MPRKYRFSGGCGCDVSVVQVGCDVVQTWSSTEVRLPRPSSAIAGRTALIALARLRFSGEAANDPIPGFTAISSRQLHSGRIRMTWYRRVLDGSEPNQWFFPWSQGVNLVHAVIWVYEGQSVNLHTWETAEGGSGNLMAPQITVPLSGGIVYLLWPQIAGQSFSEAVLPSGECHGSGAEAMLTNMRNYSYLPSGGETIPQWSMRIESLSPDFAQVASVSLVAGG